MSRFHDIQRRTIAAVDRVFAETVTLLFMGRDGRSDPGRDNVTFQAVLRTGGDGASGPDGRTWSMRIASGEAQLHIDRGTYAGPMPRKGDRLRADETPGTPLYEVTTVDDRDPGRMVLRMVEL